MFSCTYATQINSANIKTLIVFMIRTQAESEYNLLEFSNPVLCPSFSLLHCVSSQVKSALLSLCYCFDLKAKLLGVF